jgi:uncharacterized repeat protein (TIGR03943 family)
MNREAQSIVVMLFGGLLVGITVSGRYTSYVKPGFGPLLMTGGIILLLIGLLSLAQTIVTEVRRAKREATGGALEHDEVDAHGHSHQKSRAPWLMLAPVLLLMVVAPSALGADAVSRNAGSQAIAGLDVAPAAATVYDGYAPNDGSGRAEDSTGRRTMQFDPLPGGADPVITLKDFVLRSLYEAKPLITRTPVTLVGLVAPAGKGFTSGYTLARLTISCCAADANPIQIHVDGPPPFPANTWVAVVGKSVDGSGSSANDFVPTAVVSSVKQVAQPSDPYEH